MTAGLAAALADRYRIERELGQGGMATVYLAHDVRHDRKVAVKVLRPELAAVIGAERFLSEIKTTANLQHPHILPLFDSGVAVDSAARRLDGSAEDSTAAESPGRRAAEYLFYVMPFIEGESLRDRLTREKQLPVAEAVRIASEVASALDYAHRHNVIHRDIKPENILLHDGRALVADFGIALAASKAGGTRITETGMSLGTPTYMSPEQAMGEREITARSDVYALGCVTYEMLAGEPPFTGPTAQAIVARVVTERPRSLTSQRYTVPAEVEAAVFTALEKLPADRWTTAAEFAAALGGSATQGRTVATVSRGAEPPSRRVTPVVVLGAVCIAATVLAVWALSRSAGTASVPVRRWNIVLPDSAPLDFFAPSLYGEGQPAVAIARAGDRIAYVARRGGTTALYFRRLDEVVSHPVAGSEGASQPFFSPDGEWIGFFAGGELRKVAVAGGSPVVLARVSGPRGAGWTAGGRIILTDRDSRSVLSVPAAGGTLSEQPGPKDRLFWPSLLPGDEWVVGSSDSRRLVLWSLREGRGLGLTTGGPVPLESSDTASLLMGTYPRYAGSGHLLYLVGNTLMALPFDPGKRRVLGPPAPVIQELRREGWDAAGQYDVSADGTLLFASGADAARSVPVWVDHGGRVTDSLPVPAGDYFNIYASGNGRRVELSAWQPTGEKTISILDLDRGLLQELRVEGATRFTSWWPDGESAILEVGQEDRGIPWRIPISSPGRRDSLFGQGWYIIDVSRDLKYLGLRRYADSAGAWLASVDGKERQLLEPSGSWSVFSPDSRWIALPSAEGLKVVAVPPSGGAQTVAPATADEPEWSPRGDELYYRDGKRWMVMSVSTRPGLTVGKPRVLFEGRYLNVREKSYDVGPDGRFLVLLGPPEETTGHLDVVTGLFSELRRLAPPGGK
jgi:eukaryotic-like serine/threonine-protein kinase